MRRCTPTTPTAAPERRARHGRPCRPVRGQGTADPTGRRRSSVDVGRGRLLQFPPAAARSCPSRAAPATDERGRRSGRGGPRRGSAAGLARPRGRPARAGGSRGRERRDCGACREPSRQPRAPLIDMGASRRRQRTVRCRYRVAGPLVDRRCGGGGRIRQRVDRRRPRSLAALATYGSPNPHLHGGLADTGYPSGFCHCRPSKRAKSPSVEHRTRPCSTASAARCASGTRFARPSALASNGVRISA